MNLSRWVATLRIAAAAVEGLTADREIWPRLDALAPPDARRTRPPARPQEPPQHRWPLASRSHLSAGAKSDLPGTATGGR
jgi:hypothetical protein